MNNSIKSPSKIQSVNSSVTPKFKVAPLNSKLAIQKSPFNPATVKEAAQYYVAHSWLPIPVEWKKKAPLNLGWQKMKLPSVKLEADFNKKCNIGVVLGSASNNLVDVDIDAEDGLPFAHQFYPATEVVSGRKSMPRSHRWYLSKIERTRQFKFKGACICEVRSNGSQTVVPPSIHLSGEQVKWSSLGEISCVDSKVLLFAAGCFASAVMLGRSWPEKGSRNFAALALSGFMVGENLKAKVVEKIIEVAATIAGDEEAVDRGKVVGATVKKIGAGERITRSGAVSQIFGRDVLQNLCKWLGIARPLADDPDDQTSERHITSQVDRIVELTNDLELFREPGNSNCGYVSIVNDGRRDTFRIRSNECRSVLQNRFWIKYNRAALAANIDTTIASLDARAIHSDLIHRVSIRVASDNNCIFVDLGDQERSIIKIDHAGWKAVHDSPVYFMRPKNMQALPKPQNGASIDAFREFINIDNDNEWLLVMAWVLFTFHPEGPYPVLILNGGQGSAKSTATKLMVRLTDPNLSDVRSAPHSEQDLVISARLTRVLAYDNISKVPPWLSDAFCRLSTGGAFSTRSLYTDDEESIISVKRPVVINGIPDLATRPDLIDRAIPVVLSPIAETKRITEAALLEKFEACRGAITGAIYDALSGIISYLPKVQIANTPRMADFARWGVALEQYLKKAPGTFLSAYADNCKSANQIAIEETCLLIPLNFILDKYAGSFTGTATKLFKELNSIPIASVVTAKSGEDWPKSPNHLSGTIRRLAPALKHIGIECKSSRSTSVERTRYLHITRLVLPTLKRKKIIV